MMNKGELHANRLREGLQQLRAFRRSKVNAHSAEFKSWKQRVHQSLVELFGAHQYVTRFANLHFCSPRARVWTGRGSSMPSMEWLSIDQERYDKDATIAEQLLEDALEEVPGQGSARTDGAAESREASLASAWHLLHPRVVEIARERFAASHYADAVEASLKALNNEVKMLARARGADDMDGARLMHVTFSPKSPIIVLADLSSESGRDMQQGYMEMFAGAMSGIRNPKAHDNVTISPERALHLLFVVSTLWFTLDSRL